MLTIRRTPIGGRTELDAIVARLNAIANSVKGYPNIGNGTTAGKIRTNAAVGYSVDGQMYTKASTDDLWDLTGLTTLTGSQFQAIALLLNAAGSASISAGAVAATAALALAALAALDGTKSVIGVYVAGLSTNFGSALGAQGTYYNGVAPGIPGISGDFITLVNP